MERAFVRIYTIFIRYLYDIYLCDIYTKFIRYLYDIYTMYVYTIFIRNLYDIYTIYIYTIFIGCIFILPLVLYVTFKGSLKFYMKNIHFLL